MLLVEETLLYSHVADSVTIKCYPGILVKTMVAIAIFYKGLSGHRIQHARISSASCLWNLLFMWNN